MNFTFSISFYCFPLFACEKNHFSGNAFEQKNEVRAFFMVFRRVWQAEAKFFSGA